MEDIKACGLSIGNRSVLKILVSAKHFIEKNNGKVKGLVSKRGNQP